MRDLPAGWRPAEHDRTTGKGVRIVLQVERHDGRIPKPLNLEILRLDVEVRWAGPLDAPGIERLGPEANLAVPTPGEEHRCIVQEAGRHPTSVEVVEGVDEGRQGLLDSVAVVGWHKQRPLSAARAMIPVPPVCATRESGHHGP